jgi:hypothetical protein
MQKKIFDQSFSTKIFFIQTVSEEMNLQQYNFRQKKFSTKIFFIQLFPTKWFCNEKSFGQKNVWPKYFSCEIISEEMIMQK